MRKRSGDEPTLSIFCRTNVSNRSWRSRLCNALKRGKAATIALQVWEQVHGDGKETTFLGAVSSKPSWYTICKSPTMRHVMLGNGHSSPQKVTGQYSPSKVIGNLNNNKPMLGREYIKLVQRILRQKYNSALNRCQFEHNVLQKRSWLALRESMNATGIVGTY